MQKEVNNKIKYKIAIVAPAPFHYHAPLYRQLSTVSELDLVVYYCSDETLKGADIEKLYNSKGKMADPDNLLDGYRYEFLKNYSPIPSYMRRPFGLMNFEILSKIRKNKYDAVIIQGWTNFTWWLVPVVCLFSHKPYIFMTDANELGTESRRNFKRVFKRLFLSIFLFKNASGFLTSGVANENFYKDYGVPYNKMVRMPFSWGYDIFLDEGRKMEPQRDELRKKFGINKEDFIFLYMGRQSKEKLPFTLIDAYNRVNNENKKLFFVGDGPLHSNIRQYILNRNIKGIKFFGFCRRPYIYNFYNMADALVLPSSNEPWGIVVNEAMCFKLPIIASDRVGAAWDLVKDGYNGFISPAGNIEQLAICMKKMINMPREDCLIFRERSLRAVTDWVENNNPGQSVIKILELLK
jgi:glycosyltransferase involved in cell wall biosynthesis